jgi:dipeptidyl aminopeptidase/acylaminoacyl peptidase
MKLSARTRPAVVCLLAIIAATLIAQPDGKRPLTHRDYDSWKTISSQKLSDDGRWLAYVLMPQEGDGEVVLKNLETGVERREPAGAKPPTASREGEPAPESETTNSGNLTLAFTAGEHYLVFTTYPTKAATDKARKEKKKPQDMPKGGMALLPLSGGEVVRLENIRGFRLAEENGEWLAYQHEPKPESEPEGSSATAPRRGSELVLRHLPDQSEKKFEDVTEYSLSKDGAFLVYAVSSKKEDRNGVYAVETAGGEARPVLNGKGRYRRLVWDDKQTQMAFLSTRDDAASKQPKYKLYLWPRGRGEATAVVASNSRGLPEKWLLADTAALNFSKDGQRLFFSTAPSRPPRPPVDGSEERAVADLWHWKDDNVQPVQKVRATRDRNRSYRAVYHIRDKRAVQLADPSMGSVSLDEEADSAIGEDDRDYRNLIEYDQRYSDSYHVNLATGARTLLLRKHHGPLIQSPDGRHAVTFNGRDWLCLDTATGRTVNLTQGIGVAFHDEDFDLPGTPAPYGAAGWTKDSRHVLLYDRYDIWQFSPDGAAGRNITQGVGRNGKVALRYVRLGEDRTGIDPAQPLLLRAENLETRDTGFWETKLNGNAPPRKLIMAARAFTHPVKAKKADVLLLSATRFDEFGDLLVTNQAFTNLRKVSNANPQKAQFLWGSAELISYRNQDGTPLQAAVYKPENFDPHKKYPLIVYIYERLSQTVHTFRAPAPHHSINFSYYVSNGYIILTPDIIYTTGHPGQSALKCVLPAVQALVDKGYINEQAIGIQGHSWGGYQIAYMVTQTNRFRAAEAGAPVANMTSAYDGIRWGSGLPRQFQYERSQSRIGGSLWEYPLRYLDNSPLFHADAIHTPLLILHNDADDAVPWYQGIEFFLALRRLGKEAYLFNYNGEPHHLLKRANQKDYTMRMQQFFDHFLKGAPAPEWMERGIPYIEREQEKDKWKAVE